MNKILVQVILSSVILSSCDKSVTVETLPPMRSDSIAFFTKLFNPPDRCQSCHPRQYEEWSRSVHACAISEPVFLALNASTQSMTGGALGEYCIHCHAPTAQQLEELKGGVVPTTLSTLGRNGVSCEACHQSEAQTPGHGISAFRVDGIMLGTIRNPVANSFHASAYDSTLASSVSCSGCHDMPSSVGVVVEETYTEWKRSFYPTRNIQCQTCHMKYETGQAAVGGPSDRRVHNHTMVGVDVPFNDFEGRDAMIRDVEDLLHNSVHTEFLPPSSITRGEALPLNFEICNSLTGHSVPSAAFFLRQMWVQVDVVNELGDTLYRSGDLDPALDLRDNNSEYVKQSKLPYDSSLVIFNGTLYRHGEVSATAYNADAFVNHSIPAFQTRYARYAVSPAQYASSTTLSVTMRLMMRAMPPYLLRSIGKPELIARLPLYTMEERQATIVVR